MTQNVLDLMNLHVHFSQHVSFDVLSLFLWQLYTSLLSSLSLFHLSVYFSIWIYWSRMTNSSSPWCVKLPLPPVVFDVSGRISVLRRSLSVLKVQRSIFTSQSLSMAVSVSSAARRPITVAFSLSLLTQFVPVVLYIRLLLQAHVHLQTHTHTFNLLAKESRVWAEISWYTAKKFLSSSFGCLTDVSLPPRRIDFISLQLLNKGDICTF